MSDAPMTFTDAELDTLTAMLLQTDPSRIGYSGPKKYNRDGQSAAAAIAYLRSRDAIGAVVMRDRAAARCRLVDHTQGEPKTQFDKGYDQACVENAEMILTIELPTHAEILAHVRELPEVKALVEAARPYTAIMQDADYGRQMREFDGLVAALAALEAAK